MPPEQKLTQNRSRLSRLRQGDKARVGALQEPFIRGTAVEGGHMKLAGIKASHNFASVAHLRIEQSLVRQGFNQNPERLLVSL
jgi:hypothetical protein